MSQFSYGLQKMTSLLIEGSNLNYMVPSLLRGEMGGCWSFGGLWMFVVFYWIWFQVITSHGQGIQNRKGGEIQGPLFSFSPLVFFFYYLLLAVKGEEDEKTIFFRLRKQQ